MTFASIAAKIAALAAVAKAAAPQAAEAIDKAASEAHETVAATETAVTSPSVVGDVLQAGESFFDTSIEAYLTKFLMPVFGSASASAAKEFVTAGQAAINAKFSAS